MSEKSESTKKKRALAMQEDDWEIISHLAKYRYLQTRQIHALLPHRKPVAIRRRLRKMVSNKWAECLERSHSNGLTNNHAYTLGKHGLEWVAQSSGCDVRDLPFSKKRATVGPVYLDHSIMVNDLRIQVEQSVGHPGNQDIVMSRWIAEYDLRPVSIHKDERSKAQKQNRAVDKKRKYVLYEKFGIGDKAYFFKPDAAFFLHQRDGDAGQQLMCCLEADRGTEAVNTAIRNKIVGYNCFHREGRYSQFEEYAGYVVLFVLQSPTEQRIHSMRNKLVDMNGTEKLRFALQKDITPENFFKKPIWYNVQGEKVSLA